MADFIIAIVFEIFCSSVSLAGFVHNFKVFSEYFNAAPPGFVVNLLFKDFIFSAHIAKIIGVSISFLSGRLVPISLSWRALLQSQMLRLFSAFLGI